MENLLGIYLFGALVYTILCCLASLCAGFETNAQHQQSTTRMAARMWLTIPFWPVSVLVGLAYGVRKLWEKAEWTG